MEQCAGLSYEERISMDLQALYERSGYSRYKMSKFEEYDLYARNKDFLVSDNIITFTENGKLMALKPDITLSIVQGSRDIPGFARKLFYNETVYRVSDSTRQFSEIMQVGLECIGSIDRCCIAEVLILAAQSLKKISPESSLVISDIDIISSFLAKAALSPEKREQALKLTGKKSVHELTALLNEAKAPASVTADIVQLVKLHGAPDSVIPKLEEMGCGSGEISCLRMLSSALREAGCSDMISLDFSVVNNMRYYNGVVFKGYVSGVPVSVLSGGQYDKLMHEAGHASGAIGFAVYLDAMKYLNRCLPRYDVDTILLYDETQEPAQVYAAAEALRRDGSVMISASLPEKLSSRRVLRFDGKAAVPYDA
jgi:ATP phosphoribosyltransferase regulatory subunit